MAYAAKVVPSSDIVIQGTSTNGVEFDRAVVAYQDSDSATRYSGSTGRWVGVYLRLDPVGSGYDTTPDGDLRINLLYTDGTNEDVVDKTNPFAGHAITRSVATWYQVHRDGTLDDTATILAGAAASAFTEAGFSTSASPGTGASPRRNAPPRRSTASAAR